MITVNLIIEAIAAALNGEFGEEYAVYAEEVKQGLSEPCFFISCINPSDRQLMGNANRHFLAARYYRENRFCIQYFSLDENNGGKVMTKRKGFSGVSKKSAPTGILSGVRI